MNQQNRNIITAVAALLFALAVAPNAAQANPVGLEPAIISVVAKSAAKCGRSAPCRKQAGRWVRETGRRVKDATVEGALQAADHIADWIDEGRVYLRRRQKLNRIDLLHGLELPD